MPMVRNIADAAGYVRQPGEVLLDWTNTGEVPLCIGIRRGEYMIAAPAGAEQVTYILTHEQCVRLQQQGQISSAYRDWVASGLLTFVTEPDDPNGPPWGPGGKPFAA